MVFEDPKMQFTQVLLGYDSNGPDSNTSTTQQRVQWNILWYILTLEMGSGVFFDPGGMKRVIIF